MSARSLKKLEKIFEDLKKEQEAYSEPHQIHSCPFTFIVLWILDEGSQDLSFLIGHMAIEKAKQKSKE